MVEAIVRDEDDGGYRVGRTKVGRYEVSTIQLECVARDQAHLRFETMVFDDLTGESDLDCQHYGTRQEAIDGHARMVREWLKRANSAQSEAS